MTFEELLREADIVTLHATATDSAKKMMDEKAFAAMKPGAVLVNVARGKPRRSRRSPCGAVVGQARRARLSMCTIPSLPTFAIRSSDGERRRDSAPRCVDAGSAGTRRFADRRGSCGKRCPAPRTFRQSTFRSGSRQTPVRAAGWMDLSERAARFLRCISDGVAVFGIGRSLEPAFGVPAAGRARRGQGALSGVSPETVNLVNAMAVARDRGVSISETSHEERGDYAALLRVDSQIGEAASTRRKERSSARAIRGSSRSTADRWSSGRAAWRSTFSTGTCRASSASLGPILGRAGVNIADFTLSRGDGSGGAAPC